MRRIAVLLAVVVAFLLGWWLGSQQAAGRAEPETGGPSPTAAPASTTTPASTSTTSPDDAQRAPATPRAKPPRAARPEAPADDTPAFFADDPARPAGRLRTGRVTLLSLAKYKDYDTSTFSFEHGVRDDPEGRITRNNPELRFEGPGDRFNVSLVTDDESTIADLGTCDDIEALAVGAPPDARGGATRATAIAGHAYLVHSVDSQSDHYSVFHVVELVPGDRVTFDWADWTPPREPDAVPPSVTPAARTGLVRLLGGASARELSARREEFGQIEDASELVLQIRSGAQGGNTSTITLADPSTWTFAKTSATALDMLSAPSMQDRAAGYVRGGYLPDGRALVIEAVDVYAAAPSDSTGGCMLSIRGNTVVRVGKGDGPVLDWLEGCVVIPPGEERTVRLSAADSTVAEVRLHGRLIPLADAASIEAVPFRAAAAPAGAARAAGGPAAARSGYLAAPRAVIQVRAMHGGGNPMRASLLGKASIYLDKVTNDLLPVERPSEKAGGDSLGHVEGGRIPRGKAFVVTRIDYVGYITKGNGSFTVSVMGTKVASLRHDDTQEETSGTWSGRIVIPAGSEAQVFVETSWYSFGMATLTGEFVDGATAGK